MDKLVRWKISPVTEEEYIHTRETLVAVPDQVKILGRCGWDFVIECRRDTAYLLGLRGLILSPVKF